MLLYKWDLFLHKWDNIIHAHLAIDHNYLSKPVSINPTLLLSTSTFIKYFYFQILTFQNTTAENAYLCLDWGNSQEVPREKMG